MQKENPAPKTTDIDPERRAEIEGRLAFAHGTPCGPTEAHRRGWLARQAQQAESDAEEARLLAEGE